MAYLIFLILALLFMIFWLASLLYAAFLGAPSVYSNGRAIADAFKLAGLKEGELVVDLGCGDGRSLIIAAKQFGARGLGVERSPLCFLRAKTRVIAAGESRRIKIVFGDFKAVEKQLKQADVVYLYLLDKVLAKMEEWFFKAVGEKTRVVSMAFVFTKNQPKRSQNTINLRQPTTIRLYRKPDRLDKM